MTFFVSLVTLLFIVIFSLLFYNELKYNNKMLFELEAELKILKEDLKCAKSDCSCSRASELKQKQNKLEEDFNLKQNMYTKIFKKYKLQYKIISPFANKLGVVEHKKIEI